MRQQGGALELPHSPKCSSYLMPDTRYIYLDKRQLLLCATVPCLPSVLARAMSESNPQLAKPAGPEQEVTSSPDCPSPAADCMSPSAALVETIAELSELAGVSLQAALEQEEEEEEGLEGLSGRDFELDDYELLDLSDLLLETNLRDEMQRFLAKHLSPARVLMRDKLTFVLGTLHMVVSAYWLGHSPQTFYRLYTGEAALLLLLRFAYYRFERMHYYLLDWCYWCNLLLVLHVWWWPNNVLLAKVTFAHAMGPLLWSILAFRNSIVYHSLDKMTSHFMHWFPACVCWANRWHTSDALAAHVRASPKAQAQWDSASLRDMMLLPILPYLLWALGYYLKVFVISSKRIQQRGYDTLYKFSTSSRRSLFGAVVLRAPPSLQPLVYMAAHLLLTVATLTMTALWWRYYWANTAFMLAIFTASAWSGATFYFDVFAPKFSQRYANPKRQEAGIAGPTQSAVSDAKKQT